MLATDIPGIVVPLGSIFQISRSFSASTLWLLLILECSAFVGVKTRFLQDYKYSFYSKTAHFIVDWEYIFCIKTVIIPVPLFYEKNLKVGNIFYPTIIEFWNDHQNILFVVKETQTSWYAFFNTCLYELFVLF